MGITGGQSPRRVKFWYKPEDDKKEFKAPTKTGLKPLEAELQRIEQVALHVSAESDHQREREATHRDTSESLNSRVAWFSLLSLFSLFALAGAQVYYIQRYLKVCPMFTHPTPPFSKMPILVLTSSPLSLSLNRKPNGSIKWRVYEYLHFYLWGVGTLNTNNKRRAINTAPSPFSCSNNHLELHNSLVPVLLSKTLANRQIRNSRPRNEEEVFFWPMFGPQI